MEIYRDEEGGLEARLAELQQQADLRARRLKTLRGRLAVLGWIPRQLAVRRKWTVAGVSVVTVLLMLLSHLLLFQPRYDALATPRHPGKKDITRIELEMIPLRKEHGELMAALARLHRIHFEIAGGDTWRLKLGAEFLTLDGGSEDEARVLLAGWACARRYPALLGKIMQGLGPRQLQKLKTFCTGLVRP